jgi:hypothetical protein
MWNKRWQAAVAHHPFSRTIAGTKSFPLNWSQKVHSDIWLFEARAGSISHGKSSAVFLH